MFRSGFSTLRNIALAGTVLAALAAPVAAQHSGGHSSGGHSGGGGGSSHGGGGNWHGGGGGGNWHGGGGNWNAGADWHGGNGNWHGGNEHHGDWDNRRGYYGYGGYYGGFLWGYSPYYSGYGPYYGDNYYYYPNYPDNGMNGDVLPYPSPVPAEISVHVPPGAVLWFDDTRMSRGGGWRTFQTPPLNSGRTYSYEVRARWTDDNGEQVERTRHVVVRGGAQSTVDFLRPSTAER